MTSRRLCVSMILLTLVGFASAANTQTATPTTPTLAAAGVTIYDLAGTAVATAGGTAPGQATVTVLPSGPSITGVIGTRGTPATNPTITFANNLIYEFTAIACPGQPGRTTLNVEVNGADALLFCWQ